MDKFILVINSGSSSVKFGVFREANGKVLDKPLCRGSLQGIHSSPTFKLDDYRSEMLSGKIVQAAKSLRFTSIEQAHSAIADWLSTFLLPVQIKVVCYRVVHGGNLYDKPVVIDREVIRNLESLIAFAPLHQPLGLNAIEIFTKHYPAAIHKACFDTSFHRTMPKVAQTFAIPDSLTAQGIKPYGFHGLSYQFIASKLAELSQSEAPTRVIVAHLGSGASMCAMLDGMSIATTMTFTPLDGLPMSTRCGSIDAGVILYMADEMNMSPDEITNVLNKQSGLLGLSGISGDISTLVNSASEKATFALNFYVYRICREVGAMTGLLKGLDTLVFTGGAGAHCWQVREKVCQQFDWLGIHIDSTANMGNETVISSSSSNVEVFALKTDEEITMAKLAL